MGEQDQKESGGSTLKPTGRLQNKLDFSDVEGIEGEGEKHLSINCTASNMKGG